MRSREIKFRFWDLLNKRWESGLGIYADGSLGDFSECFHNNAGKNGEYYVIQQYTGLKDKNRKEIYEGDIVKFARTRIETIEESPKIFTSKLIELGEDVGEIVYMSFSFCLSFDHKRYDDIQTIGNYPHRFEVIGNIYQNPELLNS